MLRAIEYRDIGAIRKMLADGYPVDAPLGNNGLAPALSQAAKWGLAEVCEALVSGGATVNGVAGRSISPLHDAASNGSVPVCQLLVAAGAEIDSLDSSGTTPLHYASVNDRLDAMRYLLGCGADVNHVGRYGDSALRKAGSYDIALELLSAGADPNQVNEGNQMRYTVFQALVLAGEVGAVRACLDKCDIDLAQKTSMGKSLLRLASGHPDMVALLRSAASIQKVEQALPPPEGRETNDLPRAKRSPSPSAL
jgi:hypothetical protein